MKTHGRLKLLITCIGLIPALFLTAQTDMTSKIANPSFETGDYTGWTWTGRSGGWQDVNNDGDATKDGQFIAGHWNNNIADVECSQVVTGLNPGFYMVTALINVSNQRLTNQRLFANNKSTLYGDSSATPYTELNLGILKALETFTFAGYPTVATENGPFKKVKVVNQVTDSTLAIGMRFSGKGTGLGYDFSYSTKDDVGFFKFDHFTLTEVSNVASIDTILLSDEATFDSPFVSNVYTHNVTLPIGTESVTPVIKLTVAGTTITGAETVDLTSGSGVSTIAVTSLDGTTTNTYTLNYTVLAASKDNKLSELTISEGALFPVFSPLDTIYTVLLPIGTNSVTVSATPNDILSEIVGDGEVTLVNGAGKSTIKVTAENGAVKTYTINFDWAYITNPSFETGDFTGWSWVGSEGYAWVGVNTDGDETKNGSFVAGTWNGTFGDVELSQTITNLQNGMYTITAGLMGASNGTTSRLTTQRLFANDRCMLFGKDTMYSAENLTILAATESYTFGGYSETIKDNGPFKKLTVTVPVTDGTVKIGVKTNGSASLLGYTFPKLTAGDGWGWFKVDNFTMTYAGPLASLAEVNESAISYIVKEGNLFVQNANSFVVYSIQGVKVAEVKSNDLENGIALKPGLYIVKTSKASFKVGVF